MTEPMSYEELRACRERAEACFRAPWIASDPWTVEPDGGEDCEEVRSVLSPDEYPGGQVVAECHDDGIVATPGLREFAAAHSAFIAHARTDVPRLLATIAARDEEIANLRAHVDRLQESAEMSCITPADNCQCSGCLYAAEVNEREEGDGE